MWCQEKNYPLKIKLQLILKEEAKKSQKFYLIVSDAHTFGIIINSQFSSNIRIMHFIKDSD